eukprot:CAMPEP_0114320616 /NCGR_PEP_ID=MMETSP0059-20121206/26051_1 /TAXON_ID=36894 /ORGANISM="Pyramimonas parkeae, Strain CCMP726" /LENGTH=129 /DNA_ID=CAMNT_0001448065 /DNA_START=73 /DNA_END=459 /DNA_ORIENTATION=+
MTSTAGEDLGGEGEWFYIGAHGQEHGPVNFRVIRAHLRLGLLNSKSLVWTEGLEGWLAADSISVFRGCIRDLISPTSTQAPSQDMIQLGPTTVAVPSPPPTIVAAPFAPEVHGDRAPSPATARASSPPR